MTLCINPHCKNPENADNTLFCRSCGSELLLGGKYRTARLMSAKGGFGLTYEVICNNTPKVLKVLTQNAPKAVELFEQEAQILTQLNYPGIPKGEKKFLYYPRDSQTPIHCLVMEKIEGMDLEEYQKQRGYRPIDQEIALEWLKQLAEILHVVHSQNFFHRDIKPSNIILRPDGQLTLIDFGAVRQVTATIVAGQQNTGIYTPGYAPTEQEKGFAVPQSDFYALGRTLVYLLTGKHPNNPEMYDQYANELKWRSFAVDIAPELADFLDYLMADKAKERPQNTMEILQCLGEIEQLLYPPTIPTTVPPIPKSSQNNQIIPETIVSSQLPQKNKVTWKFLPMWLSTNIINIMIVFYIIFWRYVNIFPSAPLKVLIIFMLSLSCSVGVLQWLILRSYLNKVRWWILVTIIGWVIGFCFVYWWIYSFFYFATNNFFLGSISFILGGTVLGTAQYFILRNNVYGSRWWILINTIVVGLIYIYLWWFPFPFWIDSWIVSVLYSTITGLTMYWLLKHPKN